MNTPSKLFDSARTARWRVGAVALAVCCGVAGAYLVTRLITPSYQANASVVLVAGAQPATAQGAAGTGDPVTAAAGQGAADGVDASALQAMVPTVAHLAESTNVALAAAKSVHLPYDRVVGRVTAAYQPGDTIITVTATARTANDASAIANAVVDVVHGQVSRGQTVLGRGGVLAAEPLDRANPPAAATTPKPALNLALGGMLGLLAGAAAVALGAQFDTRLRTSTQIEAELGLTVLAAIPRIRRHGRGGAGRALRRRRTAAAVRAMVAALSPFAGLPSRRLLVTGPNTCDEKTMVAALLGLGFAEQELRVCVVDLEFGRPRLAEHFPGNAATSLQRLLADQGQPPRTGDGTLEVVPAETVSPALGRALLASPRFRTFVDVAMSRCDVTVLNGPPVLAGADLSALVEHVDSAILVVTSGTTSTPEAQAAAQILNQFGVPIAGVVVANASDTGPVHAAAVPGGIGSPAVIAGRVDPWHRQPERIRQKPSVAEPADVAAEPERRHEAGSAPR